MYPGSPHKTENGQIILHIQICIIKTEPQLYANKIHPAEWGGPQNSDQIKAASSVGWAFAPHAHRDVAPSEGIHHTCVDVSGPGLRGVTRQPCKVQCR